MSLDAEERNLHYQSLQTMKYIAKTEQPTTRLKDHLHTQWNFPGKHTIRRPLIWLLGHQCTTRTYNCWPPIKTDASAVPWMLLNRNSGSTYFRTLDLFYDINIEYLFSSLQWLKEQGTTETNILPWTREPVIQKAIWARLAVRGIATGVGQGLVPSLSLESLDMRTPCRI